MKFRQKHLRMKEKMCLEVTTTTTCTLVKLVWLLVWMFCYVEVESRTKPSASGQSQEVCKATSRKPTSTSSCKGCNSWFLFALRDGSPTLCDPIDPPTFVVFVFVCLFVCFFEANCTPNERKWWLDGKCMVTASWVKRIKYRPSYPAHSKTVK